MIICYADGASRGNPGLASYGAVVYQDDLEVVRLNGTLGIATNNFAEYSGVIAILEYLNEHFPHAPAIIRMDSKLVIEQMSGNWKVKHPDMQQLAARANVLVAGLTATFEWIPRERNSRADALANKAMDEAADSLNEPGRGHADNRAAAGGLVGAKAEAISSVVEFNRDLPSSVRAPGGVTEPLTTVILVRHGRTALTESKKISGSGGENPFLSEAGVHDAQKVAAELAKIGVSGPWAHLPKPSVVVASPINRTVHTAEIIAERLGLTASTNADIAEISFGAWDGHTNDEVKANWPDEFAAWQGSWSVSPPGGESLEAFDSRVQRGRRDILSANQGKTVVVVSHVMPTRGFLRAANDGGISAYWRPQISPCSISIVRFWGDQAAEIVTMNSTSHLI